MACSEAWVEKIGSEELSEAYDVKNQRQKCQPRCELQSVTSTFTASIYPVRSTFSQHPYFCLALKKVSRICSDSNRFKIIDATLNQSGMSCMDFNLSNFRTLCEKQNQPNFSAVQANPKIAQFLYEYAKTNFAILRVFIKDPFYTLIKRDEQLTTISFLGNAGGLLSLCMGLSLISIFEIFYHISRFVWHLVK